ncbi:hypothetical protein AB0F91_45610 [Amycolatopsis sp. NPDC023774]|uniref:hypothetical protein n=1 Tax=Amycolatopsis sp. NPDC023774 TaxID=3155015 RepID=UPI0033DFE7FB
MLGNDMLQVDDAPGDLVVLALNDEEGPEVIDLVLRAVNDLVDELITRPKVTSAFWTRIPAGVQKTIRDKQERLGVQPTVAATQDESAAAQPMPPSA